MKKHVGIDVSKKCFDLHIVEEGRDMHFDYTPEQVKKMARKTIRTLGKGGGHIIGPSQEIMNDVPIENVKALVETIVEERQTVLDL